MPENGKLYCTRRDLETIRQECQADGLEIVDAMLLWLPAEARAYFASSGAEKPCASALATRSLDDSAPATPCCPQNEFETCLFVVCCCGMGCDGLIMATIEGRKRRGGNTQAPIPAQATRA